MMQWTSVCLTASALVTVSLVPRGAQAAQGQQAPETSPAAATGAAAEASAVTVTCASPATGRTSCPADTSSGVLLVKTLGSDACLLGQTWGYDKTGVWVSDGCSAEFLLASTPPAPQATPPPQDNTPTEPRVQTWGDFDPGQGFLVGRTSLGELAISGYGLVRFISQNPAPQTFIDHLGIERAVDPRSDIFPHRIMVFLKGWVGSKSLIYNLILWTVNATDQDAIFAVLGYQFSQRFSLYGGLNGNPGTRSLQGSHPFWLGNDRVMADEFFRPYFSNGIWAQGETARGLWYNVMVANNSSALGIRATQLDRSFATSASAWWMPNTDEFGPRGAYGDWEYHEKVATRFGVSTTRSTEERFTDDTTGAAGNTTIRLTDSLNVFDAGALAPGVTVQKVDYRILSIDAGIKYRGMFFQTEIYTRWLDDFEADGVLPMTSIVDHGFFIQGAFYPIKKKLEAYAATSQIFGDKDAGFENQNEYLGGLNFYPTDSRNHRLNLQIGYLNRSPVNSTFGYYTGGQKGTTVATAFSVFF
jgi:hypothetical protein